MNYRLQYSILFLLLIIIGFVTAADDPYNILGLKKQATNQDIRRAYKQLAKEWHPDKSNHPEAEQKFVQIKQAYELLSDAERRRIYDQHGITSEDSHFFKQRHDYSQYSRFAPDPFEELFGKHFYFDQDISLYHKLSVTTKYYDQTIMQKSKTVPHILMFYNDWCFRCTRLVGAFKKLIDTLEPLGIQFSTVNAVHEPQLVRKSGVNDVPKLILILDGHSYIYRDSTYTSSRIVDFIRKKMPFKISQSIDDNNVDKFLGGWMDNKVRALVFEPRNPTRLRYLISAYAFHQRVAFGFVQLDNDNSKLIQERYKIHPNLDTLLIFNEDSERPVASVSMSDIPSQTLYNIISSNQFLALPRLSSQEMLEGVCPAEWNRPRKRLCVVLLTTNSEAHNFARGALRHIALQSGFSSERVRFAYIFMEKQMDFINAISKGVSDDKMLRLVIIWRRDTSHIKYEWVNGANLDFDKTPHKSKEHLLNYTKDKIDSAIQRLLRTSEALSYEAFVQNLLDEHAQSLLSKWITRFLYIGEYLLDNIEQEHILAALSLLGTIVFMFAVGYVMVYFVRAEEENLKAKGQIKSNNSNTSKQNRYVFELKLYELRAEKYNGMVRLLKPGCRTIILITDLQTREKLIPPFHKAVWPYRKSKTLMFGHMLIEKGLSWYSELLRLSLCETKNLQINPRNCVGTVIALNGHRKYFCMYHAKHPESERGAKRMVKMTKQFLKKADDPETGAFFEVDDSEDSENEPKILLEENLLDGLSLWLDRLFEGCNENILCSEANVEWSSEDLMQFDEELLSQNIFKPINDIPLSQEEEVECADEQEAEEFVQNISYLGDVEFDGLENFAGYIISKIELTEFGFRTHEQMDNNYTYVNCLSEGGLYKPNSSFLNSLENLNLLFITINGNSLTTEPKFLENLVSKSNVNLAEKIIKRFILGRTFFRIRFLNRNLKETKITHVNKKMKKITS